MTALWTGRNSIISQMKKLNIKIDGTMRKLIACLLATVSLSASAFELMDSLFCKVGSLAGASATSVDYTGGWPENGGQLTGFVMLRGQGLGHTRGVRYGVASVGYERADSIFEVFNTHDCWGGSDNLRTCFDESSKTVYSLFYNEQTDSLYMLRATAENEPCVPYDWAFRNRYDSAEPVQMCDEMPAVGENGSVDWTEALVRLYDEVRYNFVFYPRVKGRWERVYKRNLAAMKNAKNDYEAVRILQRMVAQCGDGHTYIYLPYGSFEIPGSSPFTTVMLPDGLYVRTVESHEMVEAGMRRGQKIVAVNGDTPQAWAERELRPYVCSSTPQWTVHQMYDDYNFSRSRNGSVMDMTLENPDGTRLTLNHRINEPVWDPALAESDESDFKIIDKHVGLLKIRDFQSQSITEFFDSVYPEILKTEALIIDLRGNGGGNSGYADYIARHFTDKPLKGNIWKTRVYKPAFASWGIKEDVYVAEPNILNPCQDVEPYLNEVVLLTDRGTFSSAEDFTALMKSTDRVTQIGTTTGGSTGNGVRARLSANAMIIANICSKHDLAPDGTEFVGIGIIPDIEVEESAESYFAPERDDVLGAALRHLKK